MSATGDVKLTSFRTELDHTISRLGRQSRNMVELAWYSNDGLNGEVINQLAQALGYEEIFKYREFGEKDEYVRLLTIRHPDQTKLPIEWRRAGGMTSIIQAIDDVHDALNKGTKFQDTLSYLQAWIAVADGQRIAGSMKGTKKKSSTGSQNRVMDTQDSQRQDGPFDADGFRFAGVEVRFKRAAKRYNLVTALWDRSAGRPFQPRSVNDVITEVYGEESNVKDATFRQLCSDARMTFQKFNCPLDIENVNGKVQLVRA